MAQYEITAKTFIEPWVYDPGHVIEVPDDFVPNMAMRPLNAAAEAMSRKYWARKEATPGVVVTKPDGSKSAHPVDSLPVRNNDVPPDGTVVKDGLSPSDAIPGSKPPVKRNDVPVTVLKAPDRIESVPKNLGAKGTIDRPNPNNPSALSPAVTMTPKGPAVKPDLARSVEPNEVDDN